MNLLNNLLVIVSLIVFSSGYSMAQNSFSKDGVSFKYPSDWEITEQNDLDGNGYYLAIEKIGEEESGLVVITWINKEIEGEEYMKIIQDQYKDQEDLESLTFETTKKSTFNKVPSVSVNMKFDLDDRNFKALIHTFVSTERTFLVLKQNVYEDISKNKEAFNLIESTFQIK